jgi:3-carboxy-cis,cis-muconate cycloisomerase
MPHKQNPVGSVVVLGCAQQAPGLVAAVVGAMAQEHERAAGAWQGEWAPLLELLRLTGSAAAALRETLGLLEVDPERMRANLDELVMTESVVAALGGGSEAQALVESGARSSIRERRPLRDVLLDQPAVAQRLGEAGLDRALDPEQYLGVTDQLIDRALEAFGHPSDEEVNE